MIGKTVGHIHNDNARGIVLTTGESAKGKAFVIVDWFVDKEKNKVEAKRHSPEELVELNEREIEKAEQFALMFLISGLSFSFGLIATVIWGTLK